MKNYQIIKNEKSTYVFFSDFLSIYKVEDDIVLDALLDVQNASSSTIVKKFLETNDKLEKNHANLNIGLNTIILILTRDCNLRCKYCYAFEENMNTIAMPFDIAKRSIDC